MNLKYVVPALGFAALASTASAADVGGITIGGFVDAGLDIVSSDVALPTQGYGAGVADESAIDFWAYAELQVGAAIGDAVGLQIDLEIDEDGTTDLEQANVSYAVNDQVTMVMGRFESFIGWEAVDAPGLYRIGTSQVAKYVGADSITGVDAGVKISDTMKLDVIVSDGIFDVNTNKDPMAIGFGLDLSADVEGYGNVDVEFAYDQDGAALDTDIIYFAVNTTVTMVEGMLFAGELVYWDYDADSAMGLMLMANYQVDDKMSATAMLSYVDPASDGDDDEDMEIALALLTTPTGDSNFAMNFEFAYLMAGADDSDQIFLGVEALAVIP